MISREEARLILQDMFNSCIDGYTNLLAEDKEVPAMLIDDINALDMAIEALQKQIPKKPKEYEDKYYGCPVCGNILMYKWMIYPEKLMPRSDGLPYCLSCGQAIDWSDGE